MKIDTIRAAKHAQPFKPFEMVMKDGRIIRVAHSLGIALSPRGKSVAGFDADGRPFYLPLAEMLKLRRRASAGRSPRPRTGNDA